MSPDLEKLERMQAAHSTLHAQYTAVVERSLDEVRAEARARGELSAACESGARVAAMSVAELTALTNETLAEAGIPRTLVRRIIDAERRASAARLEAEAIAERLRRSRTLLDRLEQFARQFTETLA